MKSFLKFISESRAVQQAQRMGLVGDGHGGWYKDGEFVAKTEKGQLKFYNKRQRVGQDPPQSEREKRLSQSSTDTGQQQVQPQQAQGQPVQEPVAAEPQGEPAPDTPVQFEVPENKKDKGVLTIAFGRFNPPHAGHEKVLSQVADSAEGGDYVIVPTKTQGTDKDPLDFDTKVGIMKDMFPDYSNNIVDDKDTRTIFDVLRTANSNGYAGVRIVGGGDRVKAYEKLSNDYNQKLYDFDSIDVINAGDRDEDSDDPLEAMSASVQRKHVTNGDFAAFYGNMHRQVEDINPETGKVEKVLQPIVDENKAKDIYLKLRKAMKIEEGWSLWRIAPRLDFFNLREHYVNKRIYRVGQLVESDHTGLVGKIIRRGANYLICVTEDNIMFKSWIKDVSEHKKEVPAINLERLVNAALHKEEKYTEKHMSRTMRDKDHPNTLVGTDGFRKNVEKWTPGSSWGKQFINKYRKK